MADDFEISHPSDVAWVCERVLQSGKRLEHRMPQPLKSAVARAISGTLLLKEIPANDSATIVASQGRTLIRVEVPTPTVIATRVKKIVGLVGAKFDGGKISASLMAFTLGQTVLHKVKGPGTIYFESTSRAVKCIRCSDGVDTSFDPSAVVCFGADTEFVITSGRGFWSLFAGNWQLELKKGWVVIDVGAGGGSGLGIVGLLRRAYIPWS
ncbi:hypothetical protein [Rhodopirellula sp. MGV]|uniref:hypothetical protein n=1 Tax=Rhodopirellula sp. MGV TaxID=2023130 RepID=UPI00117ADD64|nr:hypothetical protein [Rhodopirellula sp. MGV]